MVIIPAIDLLDGNCVRLQQGDYGRAEVYPTDPVEQAQRFYDLGVKRIHIVDLNAATGKSTNRSWIHRIRKSVPCQLEVGGGIRTDEDVEELLELGVQRLIVGTVFAKNPDTVRRWIDKYGNRFLAGIDAHRGQVRVAGWKEGSGMADTEAAILARTLGVLGIIYTNIEKDGTLKGPDLERTLSIASVSQLPVILSGGISSNEDILTVSQHSPNLSIPESSNSSSSPKSEAGIVGVIVGKAYYAGRVNLPDLLSLFPQPEYTAW